MNLVPHTIEFETRALRDLRDIRQPDLGRIMDRIERLADDPRPAGAQKLTGSEGWRIRQGDYRIVYTIDDSIEIVTITRVGHRRDIYRSL